MVEGDGDKGKRRPGRLLGWSVNREWGVSLQRVRSPTLSRKTGLGTRT